MANPTKVIVENKSTFPIFGILGIVFITLKLTGYIVWPWVWVLAPFWIPFAIVLGIFGLFGIFFLIVLLATLVTNK